MTTDVTIWQAPKDAVVYIDGAPVPVIVTGGVGPPGTGGGGGGGSGGIGAALTRTDLAATASPTNGMARYLSEPGREGMFIFNSANLAALVAADTAQGLFVPPTGLSGSAGAWEREVHGYWVFDWFGAVPGDWTTGVSADCLAAFNAMDSLMNALDYNVSASFVANGPPVLFPGAQYYFSDKVVLNRQMHLIGGLANELGERTFLRWPADKGGMVVNRGGSTATGEVSPISGGGASCIEGFVFQGGGGTPVGSAAAELAYSAIRVKDRCTIRNCKLRTWRGVGLSLSIDTGAGTGSLFFGNGNGITIENLRIENCKYGGVWVSGGDANVIALRNVDVANCGRFGMWLSPFLGVYAANCQVADCGYPSASGLSEFSTVSYGGRYYYAKYDATTATLKGETPGTGTNWLDMGPGSPNANSPLWDGTGNYVPGGAYGGTGAFCHLNGCYYETGQAPPQLPGALMIGGFMYSDPQTGGPLLRPGHGGVSSNKGYFRDITYSTGAYASVALASNFHRYDGDTSLLDVISWNSSLINTSNPDAINGFTVDRVTGDFAYNVGGAFNPSGNSVFVISGGNTNRTYGGRTKAEAMLTTEITKLGIGPGDGCLITEVYHVPPSSGYHRPGDKVLNNGGGGTSPATVEYWLCTVAGNPGTFVAVAPYTGGGGATVSDTAYGPSWDGVTTVAPSKNAVYDKIEALAAGGGASVDDSVYGAGWNGVTTVAPSKNAVYDKIELVVASIPAAPSTVVSDVAFAGSWDGVTGIAPSKNAVYDKIAANDATIATKKNAVPGIQSVASAATVTPTFADDQVNITAQAVGLTLANPTGTALDGWGIAIRIKDSGGARTIGYGTQYRALGVTLPTTTVANKTLYLGMVFNAADTKWDVVAVAQEA
jgi:hypothetical protein